MEEVKGDWGGGVRGEGDGRRGVEIGEVEGDGRAW